MVGLDTPLLRVSRPVAACSRCRSAKVKCDGKLPACSACERAGKADECSSTSDEFAKGKERNYVATLEMRIEKLEAQIKAIREEKDRRKSSSVMAEVDGMPPSRRASENPKIAQREERMAQRKEASNIDELVADFGLLAVNSTARDYYGFTAPVSYCRLILSACTKEALPTNPKKELPPRYRAQFLIQHFLTNVFVLHPVFEETSFYTAVDAVYHPQPSNTSPFDYWGVYMVLAIASASRSAERGDAEYQDAVGYVTAALEYAEYVIRPGSIASVQSMLLLVLYSMLDPHHYDSWTIVGAVSRVLVDLGLHQQVPKGAPKISKPKHTTRKRIFWCLYALDRSTSLAQARAFSFSDDSYNIGPVRAVTAEKLVEMNMGRRQSQDQNCHMDQRDALVLFMQPITPAIALFELRKIQSKYYTELFQSGQTPWPEPHTQIWTALKALRRWWNDLPSSLHHVCKDYLELEMLYTSVYLLGPSPRVPQTSTLAQTLIFEYATGYAHKMFRLLYAARNGDPPRAAPLSFHDAMKAYMTGRQLLDILRLHEENILFGDVAEAALSPPSSTTFPAALSPPSSTTLPPLTPTPLSAQEPYFTGVEGGGPPNAGRAISCISMFDDILGWLGMRWGSVNWQTQFQQDAKPVLDRLHSWTAGPFQNPMTAPPSVSDVHTASLYPVPYAPPPPQPSFSASQGQEVYSTWS
ncbi:MAG: hypothetical protein Q9165_004503 [Trypethelium subeluteriae]